MHIEKYKCIMQRNNGSRVKVIEIWAKNLQECFDLLKLHPRYVVSNKFYWHVESENHQEFIDHMLDNY